MTAQNKTDSATLSRALGEIQERINALESAMPALQEQRKDCLFNLEECNKIDRQIDENNKEHRWLSTRFQELKQQRDMQEIEEQQDKFIGAGEACNLAMEEIAKLYISEYLPAAHKLALLANLHAAVFERMESVQAAARKVGVKLPKKLRVHNLFGAFRPGSNAAAEPIAYLRLPNPFNAEKPLWTTDGPGRVKFDIQSYTERLMKGEDASRILLEMVEFLPLPRTVLEPPPGSQGPQQKYLQPAGKRASKRTTESLFSRLKSKAGIEESGSDKDSEAA